MEVHKKFGEVTNTPLFSVDKVTWHSTPEVAIDVFNRVEKHKLEMEKASANNKSKKR